MIVCNRPDARQKIDGFSPISPEILSTVLHDPQYWDMLSQILRICKPLVDGIGNVESRDMTLADCVIELLRIGRFLQRMKPDNNDDEAFLDWARAVFNREFKKIHTDTHHLALFLHPLCRKLALSGLPESRTLGDIIDTALKIAKRLGWDETTSRKLIQDIIDYEKDRGPFGVRTGRSDPHQWWDRLTVVDTAHPLRVFALLMHSIVPHAAEVERLFSNLGGVQSPRRSCLTVEVLGMLGTIRSHYAAEFHNELKSRGIDIRRSHAHMHTEKDGGSHSGTIDDLLSDLTDKSMPPPETATPEQDMQDLNVPELEVRSPEEELEHAFARLDFESYGELEIDPYLEGKSIDASRIYPLHELNAVLSNGSDESAAPQTAVDLGSGPGSSGWTVASLMDSMGISRN